MSSFIGHSLAAITVISVGRPRKVSLPWIGWLVIIALAPDIDYVIPLLQASQHQGLRITHSIVVSLVLPTGTLLWLLLGQFKQRKGAQVSGVQWLKIRGQRLQPFQAFQVALAGLSHLILDLLVGVTPLPLLWPFSPVLFQLPFGILPSAGRLQLGNHLLYQNLGIELGVILPAVLVVLLVVRGKGHPVWILPLSLVSLCSMVWASQLAR